MKTVFVLFALFAAAAARPASFSVDPKCPHELAAAKAAIAKASDALSAANTDFANVAAKWKATLEKDGSAVTAAAAAHDAAFAKLAPAQDEANKAKNALLDAENAYFTAQQLCKAPNPPKDCPSILSEKKAAQASAQKASNAANKALASDKKTEVAARKAVDTATAEQKTDLAAKKTAIAAAQKDIDDDKTALSNAQSAYSALVIKCAGESNTILAVASNDDASCPEEVKAAQDALKAAVLALNTTNKAFAAEAQKWVAPLDAAGAAVKKAADTHNAACAKLAPAAKAANSALSAWMDASAAVNTDEAVCRQPVKPDDCDQLVKEAEAKADADEKTYTAAEKVEHEVKGQIKTTGDELDAAKDALKAEIAKKNAAIATAQSMVDSARKAVAEKQAELNAVVIKCAGAL